VPEEKFPKSPQDIDLESAGQKLLASLPNLNKVKKDLVVLECSIVTWLAILFCYAPDPRDFLLTFIYSSHCIIEKLLYKKIDHQRKSFVQLLWPLATFNVNLLSL